MTNCLLRAVRSFRSAICRSDNGTVSDDRTVADANSTYEAFLSKAAESAWSSSSSSASSSSSSSSSVHSTKSSNSTATTTLPDKLQATDAQDDETCKKKPKGKKKHKDRKASACREDDTDQQTEPWKRYSLDVRLGDGAYAVVWKSFDSVRQEVVAIKVMKLSRKSDSRQKCDTEDRYWQRLDHENIVRWLATCLTRDMRVTAMQYCNGGDLFAFDRKVFTEYETSHVVKSVLKALIYMHTKACVAHRDVKMENVMLHYANNDAQNRKRLCRARVLLTDFTFIAPLSRSLPYKTTFTEMCGTIDYVAPEIVRRSQYTAKVDCWSTGVLTFEMLQGVQPYEVDLCSDVQSVFGEQRPMRYPMSTRMSRLVDALLCKNADSRATASEALAILLSSDDRDKGSSTAGQQDEQQ